MNALKLLFFVALMSPSVFGQTTDPLTRDVDTIIASQDPTWVHLDRAVLRFEVPPVIVNGSTYVELATLFDALDIQSSWYQEERRVTGITSDGTEIRLYIGRRDAYINGQMHWLSASPFIATPYNRTMIPLSFVATATGAQVAWRNAPRTVDIFSGNGRSVSFSSVHDVAEYVWRGYYAFGEAGPISLAQCTLYQDGISRPVYLVGLSGTDLPNVKESGNATGILEDLIVGGWNGDNDYLRAVRNVLASQVPQNASLIFSGHSLGGMVAQQAAGDSWVKDNYNVLHTVTFGSPLISPGIREGEVRRLGDVNDVVPYLSVLGTILQPWQVAGLNTEDGGFGLFGAITAHVISYRLGLWAHYDVVGRKWGTSEIWLNTGNIRYFSAPRL